MKTVKFKLVFDNIVRLMAKDPTVVSLGSAEEARIVSLINQRVRQAWQYAFWPELTMIEERPLREAWIATVTYEAGREVYDPVGDAFYRSLQNGNIGHTLDQTAWWQKIEDFDPYLPWFPLDRYPLGEVMRVTKQHPLKYRSSVYSYEFFPSDRGIWFSESIGTKVWVTFRMRPNQFTRVAWSPDVQYSLGDLVYKDDPGECCQAVLINGEEKWNKIDFPEFIQKYVEFGVYADDLMEDGQKEKSLFWNQQALDALEREYNVQFNQQRYLP